MLFYSAWKDLQRFTKCEIFRPCLTVGSMSSITKVVDVAQSCSVLPEGRENIMELRCQLIGGCLY